MASKMVVMFFENVDGYGWSERFWYSGDDTQPALNTNISDMANARAAMLTTNCVIKRVRVASGLKRNPFIITFMGTTSIPGTYDIPTAPSEVALLVLFQNMGVGYNRTFLRGIPREIIGADSYIPNPTFDAAINPWLTIMQGGNWNIVGTLGGAPTHYVLSALTPTPPRGYSFVCLSPPPGGAFAVGNTIRVHNTRIPGYKGLKVITDVTGTTVFTVGGASPPVPESGSSPYATLPSAFDAPILSAFVEKLTRRGAGRPFGLTPGRRQTLYSLRQ